jgi:flagellin FlaB
MKVIDMFKKQDVGAIGIGAMIVFIAMVLVAGIAASVLIQTSGKLETQAMQSGAETVDEVSSGISVFDIVGKKNTDLQYLAITVRARAGAPDIDLNETVILLSDSSTKTLLTYDGYTVGQHYNGSVNTTNGQIFATNNWSDLDAEHFGIIVLQDEDSSCTQTNPIINKGDKVILCVRAGVGACFGAEIGERTDVFGSVIPEVGSPGMISFTTPADEE